jgi:hypothetical protein
MNRIELTQSIGPVFHKGMKLVKVKDVFVHEDRPDKSINTEKFPHRPNPPYITEEYLMTNKRTWKDISENSAPTKSSGIDTTTT